MTDKQSPNIHEDDTTTHSHHVNVDAELDDEYLTLSSLTSIAPTGWRLYTHPRGNIYFYHPVHKVVVDDDIRIPANLEKADSFCLHHSQLGFTGDTEAHMSYGVDASISLFVNHKQCIAGYDRSKVTGHATRELSVDAFLRARRLYWNYLSSHPSHHSIPAQGNREAIDALYSYYHDHLIDGSRSIAPFSKTECEQLLEMLHREGENASGVLPAVASLVGWVLRDVYSFRTGQRYGQVTWSELRAYRKTLYKPLEFTSEESFTTKLFLMLIINGPFFGIPQTYLAHIKKASHFRGHLAGLRQSWEAYTRQLVREYSDFILIATVLLSATVGILTIDDVEDVARVAAMLAVLASLGSITVGVFFVWRHQRNTHMPSSFTYLHNARNNAFGLSGHAILLSLPPVLLVWSLIAFTVSALAYALQHIRPVPGSASSWVVLAIFLVVFAAVMIGVYTFSTIWKWQSQDSWWRNLVRWSDNRNATVD
ncbi:hypothetical protein C8Q76DRAFT_375824 [Earliella scabrosa]|nr:hypothetical protein C8Q76DRAFT_375824 [Earliella scabrosa]